MHYPSLKAISLFRYDLITSRQNTRQNEQDQNRRTERAHRNGSYDRANRRIVKHTADGCRNQNQYQPRSHNRMNGACIRTLQRVLDVRRFACLAIVIGEKDTVIYGSPHQDTFDDQQGKIINTAVQSTRYCNGNINTALYQQNKDQGNRKRFERNRYDDKDRQRRE